MSPRVLATAICDPGPVIGSFVVSVSGRLAGDDFKGTGVPLEERTYAIDAGDEAEAALAGIDRYVAEMSELQ